MRLMIIVSLLLCLACASLAQRRRPAPAAQPKQPPTEKKIFPYQYTIDELPNGLHLITIPTDYPNLVALYIVVRTGSRNEPEPGKSGYAHLFEHLMFRGSEHYTGEQRNEILKRAGVDDNAYTTDDRTVFHEVFSKEDMDKILELESDRFQHLKYDQNGYKTETKAVLGEFNKNSANPSEKIFEVLRAAAFKKHTYEHTTMGFIKDIEDMPNQYDYSLQFYNRYYRPENTYITVVGDVQHDAVLAMVKKYFGNWQRGNFSPQILGEPQQTAPREEHIDWPSPSLPYVDVAFRGPAYSDTEKDHAALDLLQSYAFGENSELYQKLVLKEQKVDSLDTSFSDRLDPELFYVEARVKDEKDINYVRDQILATFKRYTTELIPQDKLNQTRSRMRYSFALSLNSSEAIASTLAEYIALRGTPETINKLYALYDQITPEDIRAAAAKYFVDNNRTIVTLTSKAKGGAE
ncbi:MAG: insulinase family protein [Acidobacteria bacterium]|nr:MAG: insulinase family protein [Acidobacteriota bacterium]